MEGFTNKEKVEWHQEEYRAPGREGRERVMQANIQGQEMP